MASDGLRERLTRALRDEAPMWEYTFPEGNKGEVMGVPDAVVVAARTVAAWLRDKAKVLRQHGTEEGLHIPALQATALERLARSLDGEQTTEAADG